MVNRGSAAGTATPALPRVPAHNYHYYQLIAAPKKVFYVAHCIYGPAGQLISHTVNVTEDLKLSTLIYNPRYHLNLSID